MNLVYNIFIIYIIMLGTMKKLTTDSYIEKAKAINGDKYDYSKVNYINAVTKIKIICPEHGEFLLLPYNHLKGCGCPKCGGNFNYTTNKYIELLKEKYPNSPYSFDNITYVNNHTPILLECKEHCVFSTLPSSLNKSLTECPICHKKRISEQMTSTTEEFIQKAKEVYGEKYDYSKVNYINAKNKVCIICPIHGEFWILPSEHLGGRGCPKCSNEHLWDKRTDRPTTASFIEKANIIHNGKYIYYKTKYKNSKSKLRIECPIHGEFLMTPNAHLHGQGCPKCGRITLASYFAKNINDFINEANIVHNNKYDYSKAIYKNYATKICIICPEHGEFWQTPNSHLHGHGCPLCALGKNKSIGEEQVLEFIKTLTNKEVITNNRNVIPPNEIDIFLPYYNLAIEYDGLYWHSTTVVGEKYNFNKTKKCLEKGIKLIHIFEDEWELKTDIVKSILTHNLGKTKNKIYARVCKIRRIDEEDTIDFLNKNHLQGFYKSDFYYGLFFKNTLVSIMSFSQIKDNAINSFIIDRYCSKIDTNVIGGASKLLKHFIKMHKTLQILTYVDRRWSEGDLYKRLGFERVKITEPTCFYFNRNERFTLSESHNKPINEDKKIFDSGSILFRLDVK